MSGFTVIGRRGVRLAGVGAWFALAWLAFPAMAAKRLPNVVFILADDLGYGDLGCYRAAAWPAGKDPRDPGRQVLTPQLDRMASEGMRFTQHYAGSTVCAPSRATLMLGRHTGHLLAPGQGQELGRDHITVAQLLKQAGYRTALVGKWGLGPADGRGIPTRQGFDRFFGYLN